jgi:hypothetical protein
VEVREHVRKEGITAADGLTGSAYLQQVLLNRTM